MSDTKVVVLCLPDGAPFTDPRPEITAKRNVELVEEWDERAVGVAGWSSGGWDALELASQHPDLKRLVVLATPFPEHGQARVDLNAVQAKTLLLYGSKDPATGSRHGRAWQKELANARLEMVPGQGHEILVPMWHRVLAHLAPR